MFYLKYIKYKIKYLNLLNQNGGNLSDNLLLELLEKKNSKNLLNKEERKLMFKLQEKKYKIQLHKKKLDKKLELSKEVLKSKSKNIIYISEKTFLDINHDYTENILYDDAAMKSRKSGITVKSWNNLYIYIKDNNFEVYALTLENSIYKSIGYVKGTITISKNFLDIVIYKFASVFLPKRGGNMMICLFIIYLFQLGYNNIQGLVVNAVKSAIPAYKKQGWLIDEYSNDILYIDNMTNKDGVFLRRCNNLNISSAIEKDFTIISNIDLKKINNLQYIYIR